MTSPLTPQKRPDKNGKLVTRHVKTEASAGRTGVVLPAPTLAPAGGKKVSREQIINEVAEIISSPPANPTRFTKTNSLQSVVAKLKEFKDDAFISELGAALNDPERAQYLKALVDGAFYYDEPSMENYLKAVLSVDRMFVTMEKYGEQLPFAMASDTSNLFSEMGFKDHEFKGEMTDEHIGYFKSTLIAKKLGIQPSGFPVKNIYYKQIELIKDNLDAIVPALPVLVPVMGRDYYKETYADIAEVLERIEESGNSPEDIGDVMMQRHTKDFGLVNEILNNGVKSVSSGVL
jgi:hypothetical protein